MLPLLSLKFPTSLTNFLNHHTVKHEEALEYAKSVGVLHVSTSAKLNKGLEEVFISLTKGIFASSIF
jgi:hypothetical protein